MKLEVRLFAAARQLADRPRLEIELPPGATIAALRERLAEQVPGLALLARHSSFAIDGAYATDDHALREGDDVACIPPVSGG